MKVIVASFSKTGTKSINAALTILGYKVYDFMEHAVYHNSEWNEILEKGNKARAIELFKQMYRDVDAVLDMPAFTYWKEIHEAFPESKIILSVRNEDGFFHSAQKQIYDINNDWWYRLMRIVTPTGRKVSDVTMKSEPITFGYKTAYKWTSLPTNETALRIKFRQHQSDVANNAPPEKLLVYQVTDGWGPLCDFLKEEVPLIDFPYKNKSGNLIAELSRGNPIMKQMNRELKIMLNIVSMILILMCSLFIFML